MLRPDFVKRKISLIQDDLARLLSFANLSVDDLRQDDVKQAALERFLERIITRAIDIYQHLIRSLAGKDTSPPKNYHETFLLLSLFQVYPPEFGARIAKSVATRNILVHEYNRVDLTLLHQADNNCLRNYWQYCDYIMRFISTPPPSRAGGNSR